MNDVNNGADTSGAASPQGTTPPAQPQVKMKVLGQFIRDMSFENIVAQKGMGGEVTPDIKVQVDILDAKKRPTADQYEVITKYTVTSKNKNSDEILFALELDYSGIFQVEGVPQDQLHPFLLIECPRMLFPFVRRIVADVTRDGGFPMLNLDTVDFMAIYRQELQRRAEAQAASGGTTPPSATA